MQLADATPPTAATGKTQPPAQPDEAPGKVEEIVVSGYRKALESALNRKRDSNLQIESIAPEDIGKFPDTNVAESLQRLPGVQIDRSANGEGTQVLIDGLRYNLTTLNGDIFATGREFYARVNRQATVPAPTRNTTPCRAFPARKSVASTSINPRRPRLPRAG